MTWPIDAWLWALTKHCLLHSISCSRSRHIFTCSMLALWLSLTSFCFSRSFWSHKGEEKKTWPFRGRPNRTGTRVCRSALWDTLLTLPSNSCSEMFFMYTSLQEQQKSNKSFHILISRASFKWSRSASVYPDMARCDFLKTCCAAWKNLDTAANLTVL